MKSTITESTAEAVKVIAQAAQEAKQVIADSAANAVRVNSVQKNNDHDILIELKTRMEGLKNDIRDLTDGTATKIANHETRINVLELAINTISTKLVVGISLLSMLAGLLFWHVLGIRL